MDRGAWWAVCVCVCVCVYVCVYVCVCIKVSVPLLDLIPYLLFKILLLSN